MFLTGLNCNVLAQNADLLDQTIPALRSYPINVKVPRV